MTPEQIISGIKEKNRQLVSKEAELITLVNTMAEAEKEYRVARASETLKLKADKHPVTLIKDIVKGDKHVADLNVKFIVAEGVYKACKDSMYNLRSALDSYRSILSQRKLEYEHTVKKGEHIT